MTEPNHDRGTFRPHEPCWCSPKCELIHGDQGITADDVLIDQLQGRVRELEARPGTTQELVIDEIRVQLAAARRQLLDERARFDEHWMKSKAEGDLLVEWAHRIGDVACAWAFDFGRGEA